MFESDTIKEIFEALKYVFHMTHKRNLPVYGVPDKLKDYATSKKDISNGVEVNPKEDYRLKKEDRYEEQLATLGGSDGNINASTTLGSSADDINEWNNEV